MTSLILSNLLTDYWVNSVIVGFIVIAGLILSVTILGQNKKSITNQSIAVLFTSVTFWILFAHLGDSLQLRELSLLFERIVYASLFFWVYSLFMMGFVFPTDSGLIKKPVQLGILIFTIILSLIAVFTNKFLADAQPLAWGVNNIDGDWSLFFYIYLTVMMLPLLRLVWVYRKAELADRKKLKYFFLGLILFLVGVLAIYLWINPAVGDQRFYRFGNYSAAFLIVFTAFAILRHQLFNVRVIMTEAAVIVIGAISAVQVFAANSVSEGLLRSLFLVLIVYGGYLLIGSVKREIKQRQEIQLLADELKEANEHLKELDQEKDDFLSMASHELNSPLAAIRGYLSMMLEEHMGGRLSVTHQKYLTNISISTDRLIHLVKDLLNVSRIEQHRIHLVYSQVSVNDLINQAISEIQPNVNEKKHHLSTSIDKTIPQTWCDADRITEVIINLLSNSVKYTDEGGKLEVFSKRAGDAVEVTVKDNGFGVSKETQGKIFEKFEQGKITRDEKKGTGLGLFIVKNLVELHKGKIWLDSEEGKGSEFHFTVPILDKKPHDAHEGEGEVLKLG